MGRQKKPASNADNTLGTQSTTTADISQASPVPFIGNPAEDEPQPKAFVQRGDPDRPAKRRVSFPVTEDGKHVDWDTLRDKGKAELTDVLTTDPEIAKLLGKASLTEEFPFEFTEKDARDALGFLNQVNAFSTRFFFGRFKNFPIDSDVCDRAFTLKPEDEETLAKRGAKLANKYSGEWLRRHADLVMFLGLYFKCVTQQTITAITLQAMKNQAAQANIRPNGHPAQAQPERVQP